MFFRWQPKRIFLISSCVWTFLFVAIYVGQHLTNPQGVSPIDAGFFIWICGVLLIGIVHSIIRYTEGIAHRWIISVILSSISIIAVSYGVQRGLSFWVTSEIVVDEGPPRKEAVIIREDGQVKKITATVGKSKKTIAYDLIWLYFLAAGIVYTASSIIDLNAQKLEQYRLRDQLSKAELNALRTQLNPHFLFNALNTVSSLMDEDTREAQRVLESFSFLLRDVMDRSKNQFVSLSQELVFIDRYISIEKRRFAKPFEMKLSIANDVKIAKFPAMILQPIVENAIKHGILRYAKGDSARNSSFGKIEIVAHRSGKNLWIGVRDDGPGVASGQFNFGTGLNLTEQRLKTLYNDQYRLMHQNTKNGGFEIAIEIPFEEWKTPGNV